MVRSHVLKKVLWGKQSFVYLATVLIAFSVAAGLPWFSASTSALGKTYYDDNGAGGCDLAYRNGSGSACGGNTVKQVVGETQYVRKTGTIIRAYFKNPYGRVRINNANYCRGVAGDSLETEDWFGSHGMSNGTKVTIFRSRDGGRGSTVQNEKQGRKYAGNYNKCRGGGSYLDLKFKNLPAVPGVNGLYFGTIQAVYIDRHGGGWDGLQNAFDIVMNSANGNNDYMLAHAGDDKVSSNRGYRSTVQQIGSRNNDFLTYVVKFGTPCTVQKGKIGGFMSYYDMDNAGGGGAQPAGQDVTMQLIESNKNGSGSKVLRNWTPASNDNSTGSKYFGNYKPNKRYEWKIKNVYYNNTLQFSTPFDGVYYSAACIPPNNNPTGVIRNVTCNPNTGRIGVRVTFRDKDANTRARITLGNGNPASDKVKTTNASPSWRYFYVPYVNPYKVQNIKLHVRDTGPGGDGNFHLVDTSQTVLCVDTSCGTAMVTPSNIDPTTRFSITVSVSTSVTVPPPPTNYMRLEINPVPPATWSYDNETSSTSYDSSTGKMSATFNNLGPTNQAGNYRYNWHYRNTTDSSLDQSCGYDFSITSANFWVANMPYLKVYGGDATAGGYQQSSVIGCAVDDTAGFYSWNNDGSPNHYGAGGQLAVLAMNLIEHFVSNLSGTNGNPPSRLSFANTSDANNNGQYGGNFGATTGSCDFIDDAKAEGVGLAGNVLSGRTLSVGQHQTIYVEGKDVYISGKVDYAGSGSWGNENDIPSFKLVVVGGNIYVDNNVEQLDGLYVAVPNASDNGGEIITCAFGAGSPYDLNDSGAFGACDHKLRVYGSFAAKSVEFNRTFGTIGAASEPGTWSSLINGNSAETFIYTPEMWIPNGSGDRSVNYDSVIGLPPVL